MAQLCTPRWQCHTLVESYCRLPKSWSPTTTNQRIRFSRVFSLKKILKSVEIGEKPVMDQWIRCFTAGSTFALSTSTGLRQIINLISAFYCGRSTLPLVFHHGKEEMEIEKKTTLAHSGFLCWVFRCCHTVDNTSGTARRAMEHLSFQGPVPEFKISFLVFNNDILLIN